MSAEADFSQMRDLAFDLGKAQATVFPKFRAIVQKTMVDTKKDMRAEAAAAGQAGARAQIPLRGALQGVAQSRQRRGHAGPQRRCQVGDRHHEGQAQRPHGLRQPCLGSREREQRRRGQHAARRGQHQQPLFPRMRIRPGTDQVNQTDQACAARSFSENSCSAWMPLASARWHQFCNSTTSCSADTLVRVQS